MPTPRSVLVLVLAAAALIAVACSARLAPPTVTPAVTPTVSSASSASAPPSTPPPASPSPALVRPAFPPGVDAAASLPVGRLPTGAVTDRDGVRLRLVLDRDPMPAGKVTWVTTELTNTGQDTISWISDGCGIAVGVSGKLTTAKWRAGVEQSGRPAEFKHVVNAATGSPDDGSMLLHFVPAELVGMGDAGCADIGIAHELGAGRTIRGRQRWDGNLYRQADVPPTAEVEIAASFWSWHRAADGVEGRREPVEATVRAWIAGSNAVPLSPAELADIALFDPTFNAWVTARDRGGWWRTIVERHPGTPLWRVGLARQGGDTRIALVDPVHGSVVSVVRGRTSPDGRVAIVPGAP